MILMVAIICVFANLFQFFRFFFSSFLRLKLPKDKVFGLVVTFVKFIMDYFVKS